MTRHLGAVLFLTLVAIVSGVMVVVAEYDNRKQFRELQVLEKQREQLDIEWGQLELEQGAWTTHSRIEALAGDRLGMKIPQMGDTVMVQQ